MYFVEGTPTDCVHLAVSGLFPFEPDMVVSGVNDGSNLGDDVLYSGTVAAATEGRFLGKPSVAVSLHTDGLRGDAERHFETGAHFARADRRTAARHAARGDDGPRDHSQRQRARTFRSATSRASRSRGSAIAIAPKR